MILFGRRIQFVWWWRRPRLSVWRYPEWDMRLVSPDMPGHYWTGYDFGIVAIRVWWKGWEV